MVNAENSQTGVKLLKVFRLLYDGWGNDAIAETADGKEFLEVRDLVAAGSLSEETMRRAQAIIETLLPNPGCTNDELREMYDEDLAEAIIFARASFETPTPNS
jgi:hypothetical protein